MEKNLQCSTHKISEGYVQSVNWAINRYIAVLDYAEKILQQKIQVPMWGNFRPQSATMGMSFPLTVYAWLNLRILGLEMTLEQKLPERYILALFLDMAEWNCSDWNFSPRTHAWGRQLVWKTLTKQLKGL